MSLGIFLAMIYVRQIIPQDIFGGLSGLAATLTKAKKGGYLESQPHHPKV